MTLDIEEKRAIRKANVYERYKNRMMSNYRSTIEYAIKEVKSVARQDCWSSSHANCFTASFGKSETKEHRDLKYKRWEYHRGLGNTVFTELILNDGSRPDLIVCTPEGDVFIEEIIVTEGKESIKKKEGKYPFRVIEIKMGDKNE